MPKRWTIEEEEELLRLFDIEKKTLEELAKKYDVTVKSVSVKLQKIRRALKVHNTKSVANIPRTRISKGGEAKRWTPEDEKLMYEMYLKGWKTDKIAAYFNVTQKAASVKLLKVKKRFSQIEPKSIDTSEPTKTSTTSSTTVPKEKESILKTTRVKVQPEPPKTTSKPESSPTPPTTSQNRPINPRGKNVEGEVSTQFKVWNGTEWVIIKVPKKLTHM
ncbi:MAG: hypothetical protein N2450_06580 [bacterium]|nr:hypothetical protein [bacterium]